MTKSGPKKTEVTPSIANNCLAKGETIADLFEVYSKDIEDTGLPGLNLSELVFGVISVWMNIDLSISWYSYFETLRDEGYTVE